MADTQKLHVPTYDNHVWSKQDMDNYERLLKQNVVGRMLRNMNLNKDIQAIISILSSIEIEESMAMGKKYYRIIPRRPVYGEVQE